MRNILLIYYSRSGTTKKIAEAIKDKLACDVEEIICVQDRSGVPGYLLCGKEATRKRLAEIKPASKNAIDYDLVIIGTPIWIYNLSTPTRSYLKQNIGKFKKLAAFCTMGSSGAENAFAEIEQICQLTLAVKMSLSAKEIAAGGSEDKIDKFVKDIKDSQ